MPAKNALKDEDIIKILSWFHDTRGYWPTASELAIYLPVSVQQIYRILMRLERRKHIKRLKGIRNFQLL